MQNTVEVPENAAFEAAKEFFETQKELIQSLKEMESQRANVKDAFRIDFQFGDNSVYFQERDATNSLSERIFEATKQVALAMLDEEIERVKAKIAEHYANR